MITRPLDLASRLRSSPKNFDVLHLFNVALVALFFVLFGSRFVLAPGVSETFQLPESSAARAGARTATHTIALHPGGRIIADQGPMNLRELTVWLKSTARDFKQPVLLIQEDQRVTMAEHIAVSSAALEAGFEVQVAMNPVGNERGP